ncbi:MAG: hypothetical protein JW891_06295 [Candidatus Lokiarchaeota archaeon]|nr:hypothetical protein [Candidatus Lokiarchaeota archaeon]
MTENSDLKELEKKAYRSTFQDGIWDIYIGMLIVVMGLYDLDPLFGLPDIPGRLLLPILLTVMAVVFFTLGKKLITVPRMGLVKFGPKRKAAKKKLMMFLIVMFFLNIIFLIVPFTGLLNDLEIDAYVLTLCIGLFITIPFSVVAYFLDFKRLYYYAIAFAPSFLLVELLYPLLESLTSLIVFLSIGGSIITIGLVFLVKFLKAYRIPKEGADNEH